MAHMNLIWLVQNDVRSERIRAGLCAACGERGATVRITPRPRSAKRARRHDRRHAAGFPNPQAQSILCRSCAAWNHAAYALRRPPPDKLIVFLRDGGRCAYCGQAQIWSEGFGKRGNGQHSWGIDHIMPRKHSLHGIENKTIACIRCGGKKADRTPEEWMADNLDNPARLPAIMRARAEALIACLQSDANTAGATSAMSRTP